MGFPALRSGEFNTLAPTAPVLSAATEADFTDTTVTVGCSTTVLDGTLYYFISTNSSPPSAYELRLGIGAVDYGSDSSVTSPNTFAATGLSASTTYYTYFVQEAGETESAILESGSWSTIAGGVSIPIAAYHYNHRLTG